MGVSRDVISERGPPPLVVSSRSSSQGFRWWRSTIGELYLQVRSVALGDQLEVMAGGVVEVDAAASVVRVDLARPVPRAAPERQSFGLDALERVIEDVIRHEQRVVLPVEVDAWLGVVETDASPSVMLRNGPHPVGSGSPSRFVRNVAECCLSLAATAKWSSRVGKLPFHPLFAHLHTADRTSTARDAQELKHLREARAACLPSPSSLRRPRPLSSCEDQPRLIPTVAICTDAVATPTRAGDRCAVRALQAWLHAAGIHHGPVLRRMRRGDTVTEQRLSDPSVALIVKRRARAAGLPPALLSGHSLRAGYATAAAAGIEERKIANVTRHKYLPVLRAYIRATTAFDDVGEVL